MAKVSAGILICRRGERGVEVMLVHPGGPFWRRKDAGAWTIPKGEVAADEAPIETAKRELREETGLEPAEDLIELTPIKQKGGKAVHAWAMAKDCDPEAIESATFTMEWPPRSGRQAEFPEVDRAAYFPPEEAKRKINPAQAALIDELLEKLGAASS